MIEAGKLRRRIVFQKTVRTLDSFQNPQDNWADDFQDRAEFQALGSVLFPVNWKRYGETTARFKMRFRQDVDPAVHRILMVDDRFSPAVSSYWMISPPYDEKGRMREMFIEAKEVKGTN